ncbi:MAG: hypothetical protein M3460_19075 [Actinomycetota bacterium]|nr:hypothetical protein [Actinomycetota bacterium]
MSTPRRTVPGPHDCTGAFRASRYGWSIARSNPSSSESSSGSAITGLARNPPGTAASTM